MFARNVSIRLKPGKLNEFTRTFDKEVLSILRKQPGFREEIICASPGEVELTAISLWDSKEQADAYNASAYSKVLQVLNTMLDGALGIMGDQPNLDMFHSSAGRGEDIVVRGYLKPISTLRRPLHSVDFASREPVKAAYERSDVCVVPAAGVAAEAMVALTLARCALEKFGGDSMLETLRNFKGYLQQVKNY